jgi:hypothetical protein
MLKGPSRVFLSAALAQTGSSGGSAKRGWAVPSDGSPLASFNEILASDAAKPAHAIKEHFRRTFKSNQSLISYAGRPADVDELAQLLVRVHADTQSFDELRYLFATQIAALPSLSEELCAVYLASLARAETFTVEELEGTLAVMRSRGATLSGLDSTMAIAEMQARCGHVALSPVLDALAAIADSETDEVQPFPPEKHGRLVHFVVNLFRIGGWSRELLRITHVFVQRGAVEALRAVTSTHIIATLIRDSSLPANDVCALIEDLIPADAFLDDAIQGHLAAFIRLNAANFTPARLRALVPLVQSDAAISACMQALMRKELFDEGFAMLEEKHEVFGTSCRWLNSCRPLTAAKADGMYFALERRKEAGQPVSSSSLDAIMWACAFLGDVDRAGQTIAVYPDFGHKVSGAAQDAFVHAQEAAG